MKKSGNLSAVADKDGNIVTDKDKITDIVVTDLAGTYCSQKSAIIKNRNDQLVKEVLFRDQSNFEQWAPKEQEPMENEQYVCRPTSIKEINSHKDEHARGIDGIMSTMLKHSSQSTSRNLLT